MGTDYGTQRVQDDLTRRNRILERRIKILEFALKTERSLTLLYVGLMIEQRIQDKSLLRRKTKRRKTCLLQHE